jgi:hypothetical protein
MDHHASDNIALPLWAAESQFMMLDKQVRSWSGRGHIDSPSAVALRLIDVGNAKR